MKRSMVIILAALLLLYGMAGCNAGPLVVIPPLPSTNIPNDDDGDTMAIDPRNFGGKADGITNDGPAIQRAIDRCAQKGGGIVVLKNGTFLSSPLVLKSKVYLKVVAPAVLKAVPYANYPQEMLEGKPAPLIGAVNASNIGVFGSGTIDGNGPDWWRTQGWISADVPRKKIPNQVKRPYLVYFIKSCNIIVKDVTLQNSASFNLVPQDSEHVVISNIAIYNPANSPNTDAIDPSGRNIFIDHVTLDTGDDNIAIKAHVAPTKFVYITNSTFLHGHGLSIGSDFEKGVENIYAQHCTFINTETGIRIKSARERGGLLKNVNYSDIKMKNVRDAILITEYYPKVPPAGVDKAQRITDTTPRYQDITISGVTAAAARSAGGIIGLPESSIDGLLLKKVTVNAPKGMTLRNAHIVTANTVINAATGSSFIKEENSDVSSQ